VDGDYRAASGTLTRLAAVDTLSRGGGGGILTRGDNQLTSRYHRAQGSETEREAAVVGHLG
jgi:hypothetical protein